MNRENVREVKLLGKMILSWKFYILNAENIQNMIGIIGDAFAIIQIDSGHTQKYSVLIIFNIFHIFLIYDVDIIVA